jgi:hypothetical protein
MATNSLVFGAVIDTPSSTFIEPSFALWVRALRRARSFTFLFSLKW